MPIEPYSLFDRVARNGPVRRGAVPDDPAEQQLLADMVELVVETVEPRVRMNPGYQAS